MLSPLTTEFRVLGDGFKTLKEIARTYKQLRNSLRGTAKENDSTFLRMGKSFKVFLNKIKSGTVRIGNSFKRMFTRIRSGLSSLRTTTNPLMSMFTRLSALIGVGALIKNGVGNSTNLEMTRTAIASMRGEKRANSLMSYGVNFANVTPYQTNEVLDAVKKMEIRGIDPTKHLEGIGNMSAMLGKGLDQGVEAILDAMTGEYERLKEFGITKNMVMNEISVGSFDGHGSLINQKKMFDDLMRYIEKRYEGGMEKLSKTTQGMWSTVKGLFGSFMSMIFTGSQTGYIFDNSPLGVFRNEILIPLTNSLLKWQKDGTFSKISRNIANGILNIYKKLTLIGKVIKKYKEFFISLAGGFVMLKIASSIAMLVSPVNQLAVALVAIGSAFTYMYRNFDGFREGVDFLVRHTIGYLKFTYNMIKDIVEFLKTWKDLLGEGFQGLKNGDGTFKLSFEENTGYDDPNIPTNPIKNINNSSNNNVTININGGDTKIIRKTIEDVLFEKQIRSGAI